MRMPESDRDPVTCVRCGGGIERRPLQVDIKVASRRAIPVTGLFAACASCGEVYFAPGEADAAARTAATIVREREGLLTSDEIIALRSTLGLTQVELERVLGVGPKTVVRWERGTVFQSRAVDTLLRVLRAVPAARAFLVDSRLGPPVEGHR